MGAKRTDMNRLVEVVRLHRLGGNGLQIARPLRMGPRHIRQYLEVFGQDRVLDGPADALPDVGGAGRGGAQSDGSFRGVAAAASELLVGRALEGRARAAALQGRGSDIDRRPPARQRARVLRPPVRDQATVPAPRACGGSSCGRRGDPCRDGAVEANHCAITDGGRLLSASDTQFSASLGSSPRSIAG